MLRQILSDIFALSLIKSSAKSSRGLKNIFEAANNKAKVDEKAKFINTHFESSLNTAVATQIDFQQPDNI